MYGPQTSSLTEGMPLTWFGRKPKLRPTKTPREIVKIVAKLLNIRPRIIHMPLFLLKGAGIFDPVMREVAEMKFQYDRPYPVDSSAFSSRFWHDATTFEAGLLETVEYYKAAPSHR